MLQRPARVPLVTRVTPVTLPASARRQPYSEEPLADLFGQVAELIEPLVVLFEPMVALFGLGVEPELSPLFRANYMPT